MGTSGWHWRGTLRDSACEEEERMMLRRSYGLRLVLGCEPSVFKIFYNFKIFYERRENLYF